MSPELHAALGPAPAPDTLTPGHWPTDLADGLAAMIVGHGCTSAGWRASEPPLAVFDWDETCISGDISETWLRHLSEPTGGRLLAEYEAACHVDKRKAYVDLSVMLLAGRTEREVRASVLAAWRRGLSEGTLRPREEIRELVWAMSRHGWDVRIVSASPGPVVRAVAQGYGLAPERVLGMQAPVGADGRYLPQIDEPIPYREGKLAAIDHFLGRRPVFVAGDSDGDLWMMRAARHALLVDRGNAALRDEARAHGWWVREAW